MDPKLKKTNTLNNTSDDSDLMRFGHTVTLGNENYYNDLN